MGLVDGLGELLGDGDTDGLGTVDVIGASVGVALGAKFDEIGDSFVFCAVGVFHLSDHGAILINAYSPTPKIIPIAPNIFRVRLLCGV